MKKARLCFSPIDYEYQRRHGIMPDYHYDRMLEQGYSAQDAARIRQDNIIAIWKDMCWQHGREKQMREQLQRESETAYEFTYTEQTPFCT